MRLLLDTHVLLWALVQPERIPAATRAQLVDRRSEVLFSAASIWELAIKMQTGRLALPVPLAAVEEECRLAGFRELPITSAHGSKAAALPPHHRDPFDRMLVAQALLEPAHLLSADRQLPVYSDLVILLD